MEYQGGSLTQREMAARHGISVGTLQNWLRQQRSGKPERSGPGWIEVIPESPTAKDIYRLEFPGGQVLVLGPGWRPEEVRALVGILRLP